METPEGGDIGWRAVAKALSRRRQHCPPQRQLRTSPVADFAVATSACEGEYGQVRRRRIVVACPERLRRSGYVALAKADGGGKNVIVNNTVVENQPLTLWNGNGEVVVNNSWSRREKTRSLSTRARKTSRWTTISACRSPLARGRMGSAAILGLWIRPEGCFGCGKAAPRSATPASLCRGCP